jgi:uncharacterized lipoprotein YajG
MKTLLLALTAALLSACAAPPTTVAEAGVQKCMPRDAPIGTHMPSRKCAPVTEEDRARAQAEAQEMREDANRATQSRILKP